MQLYDQNLGEPVLSDSTYTSTYNILYYGDSVTLCLNHLLFGNEEKYTEQFLSTKSQLNIPFGLLFLLVPHLMGL